LGDEFTSRLDLYLDGELPASEMKAVDAHLRGCPSCAADVLGRVQMKRALQSAGKRYHASPELRARIQRQIAPRARASVGRLWLSAAAVIAVLLVATLVVNYVGQQRLRREQALSEIVDLHVAALASTNPVDVPSSDRHTVKPWFQGKIAFTFNLPELENSEFTLLGGRVAYLHQTPGAELIYHIRKHNISVFIFPEQAISPAWRMGSRTTRHLYFNLQTWSEAGLRYILISDTTAQDVAKLADMLKAAARG
jgi:anti-sigma factor RsiW